MYHHIVSCLHAHSTCQPAESELSQDKHTGFDGTMAAYHLGTGYCRPSKHRYNIAECLAHMNTSQNPFL